MTEDKKSRRLQRWTPEQVLEKIKSLQDLSAKYNQRTRPDLYGAAIRYFGGWKAAVESAGFNYSLICKRKPFGHWNKDRIIHCIQNLEEKNSGYVRKHHPDLYNAALRVFQTWKQAIEAAGFDYDKIRKGWIADDSDQLRFRKK